MRKLAALIALILCAPVYADEPLTGTFDTATATSGARACVNGVLSVTATGSFGGGTMTLQYKHPVAEWTAVPDAAYTAATAKKIEWGSDMAFRWDLTGATSPDIDWSIDCEI